MADSRIRVGIIGANVSRGWGSSAHIPALLALPEYELAAVCTAHQETAQEAAQKFGARLAFHDHRELVSHPEIDLVTVAVRVPYHHQLTMDALRAGKHVYTEWPLGATLAEAQEMAELAHSKGVRTLVGLQNRCAPPYLRMKELIAEGYVGEVLACHVSQFNAAGLDRTSDRLWASDRHSGVGTLTIGFAHTMDAVLMCVGELAEVSGVVATQVPQWYMTDTRATVNVTTPDNVLVSGKLKSGAVVSAHVGAIPWHGSGLTVQVYGREGSLVYRSAAGAQPRLEGAKRSDAALQELPIPAHLAWVPENTPKGPPFNVAQMYRRFAEAIRSGQPVEPDFDSAVKAHRLLDAIQQASDQGKRIALQ